MKVAVGGNLVRRDSIDVHGCGECCTVIGTTLPLPLVAVIASIESETDEVNTTTSFVVELASPLVDNVVQSIVSISSLRGIGTSANLVNQACTFSCGLTTIGAGSSLSIGEVSLCQTEQEEVCVRERSIVCCCVGAVEVSPLSYAVAVGKLSNLLYIQCVTIAAEQCTVVVGSCCHVV